MLTFANPLFLWGLLGLAVPVVIHLIQRDLFRPLRFPSVRFIRRGSLPVERKKRLRDLPLLLLRLLLLAALIFALARPEWQPRAAAAAEAEAAELVLVLDASASMSGWNAWEDATEQALARLDEHSGPAGLVVSTDRTAHAVPLTHDHAEIRRTLSGIEPEPVAGRHREALAEANGMFSAPGSGALAVFSDFQQSDWSPAALPDLSNAAEIEWVRVGEERGENVAILSAAAFPLPDGRLQVVAEVRNFGETEASRNLELAAGDHVQRREITLAAGEQRSESFTVSGDTSARAELRLDTDAYSADDSYYLWLGEPPPARVVLVAPLEEEPEKAREVFFLQRALTATSEGEWIGFSPSIVEPDDLTDSTIGGATAILLLGAGSYLQNNQWGALNEFTEAGGLLLLTPGSAPGTQFARMRDHDMADLGVAGDVRLDRNRRLPYAVDWIDPESALATLFEDEAARSLYNVSLYRHLRLENRDEDASELLRSDTDEPILFEKPHGRGRLLISAFAFDTAWTDFPISGAFLPMIRELVSGHLTADHGIVNIEAGASRETLRGRLATTDEEAIAAIDTRSPGIRISGETPVIVNVPRSESTPETTSLLDLESAAAPATASATSPAALAGNSASRPLWPWLAVLALLAFLLEIPVAALLRRGARGRGKAAAPGKVETETPEPAVNR